MITYLKSETKRLEKGCNIKLPNFGNGSKTCGTKCVNAQNGTIYCRNCLTKLSTLIKTSWIFAKIEVKNTGWLYKRFNDVIVYCEAKAKEHKIDLEDEK